MSKLMGSSLVFVVIILMVTINLCPLQADPISMEVNHNVTVAESDITYAPSPSRDPALAICASRITLDCGVEIIRNDEFFTVHLGDKCCRQLIRMGKTCNDLIVHDLLSDFAKFKKRSTEMHQRSDYLWNKCLNVGTSNSYTEQKWLSGFLETGKIIIDVGNTVAKMLHG
ncbi:uncharacterized protein LOC125496324 [Beta vulgaris subsp. vulgaris]|uniref:uncharacterized protein LOC125496324 n=2 Tax=Beta vulgaris subsp. vulgaris TaxID=3555 RepID=UPI00203689CE|nr:uncharacterized protein LOC125496324 [Beta vulgaris subsp. vulgaris]